MDPLGGAAHCSIEEGNTEKSATVSGPDGETTGSVVAHGAVGRCGRR